MMARPITAIREETGYFSDRTIEAGGSGREKGNMSVGPEEPPSYFFVVGNHEMMLATLRGGQADVTAGLSCNLITELAEGLCEVIPRKVTGKPHTAITSSRTWCSLTTLGDFPSAKWHHTASRTFVWSSLSVSASVKIDSPSARAVKPPSGASYTTKISSFMRTSSKLPIILP